LRAPHWSLKIQQHAIRDPRPGSAKTDKRCGVNKLAFCRKSFQNFAETAAENLVNVLFSVVCLSHICLGQPWDTLGTPATRSGRAARMRPPLYELLDQANRGFTVGFTLFVACVFIDLRKFFTITFGFGNLAAHACFLQRGLYGFGPVV